MMVEMPHFNYKLIMSCYQGITFTVPFFASNSYFFVKIATFVMVNEVKGHPYRNGTIYVVLATCMTHNALLKISACQRGFIT